MKFIEENVNKLEEKGIKINLSVLNLNTVKLLERYDILQPIYEKLTLSQVILLNFTNF